MNTGPQGGDARSSSADPGRASGPGDPAFGRYRLLERLGEGGMAEVYKAKSFGVEGFEKVLVIKRILPKLAEHARFVDMFVHEAKLAVRLSHANIVQVFDLGRVDQSGASTSYFIAMEYVPGLDLATLLSRCRRQKMGVPLGMAVFIAAEVAKALDHAHRRRDEQSRALGIVHRDISPQNILLSWEGEVKVTDFGIAKAKDSITEGDSETRPGRVRGKLAYMSPEQASAGSLDGRSDIFSLGTVLYEMIAGSNPFVGPTSFETQRRVQASEYPPLELLRPDTPKVLVDIVARMLAKDPEARFADAGKLHEQLLGFFYASGERFGGSKLAEFLERFHDDRAAAELEGAAVFDERNIGNERTPVEVPNPNQQSSGLKPTTANLFPQTGTGEPRLEPLMSRTTDIGERREVTGLALSFFGENRGEDPAHPSQGLRGFVARSKDILARYGALLLEEDPSHLVAVLGLGDADGRDTEAAVRAALVILRARGAGVSVAAGVHVARVLVDPAGALVRDERVASLLAAAQALARATDGHVAVSRIAARIVRNVFTTDELPGSGTTAPEGGRIISSARSPSLVYGRFIGRHDELKRLGDILATATRRRAQLITIQGDQGVGKTRMVAEMERRLTKGNYNVGFYVASCPKNGAEVRWSGLASMLRVLCGIQEGDDEARVLEVLPRLRALGLHSDESTAVLAQLGALVTDSRQTRGDVTVGLAGAFSRMVHGLCDDRLHVFVFDDAHAIDQATLEVILAVAGRGHRRGESIVPPSSPLSNLSNLPNLSSASPPSAGGLRAVFALATREPPPEALTKHPEHHLVNLAELPEADAAKLIGTRVGARVLSPELLAFCRERAGGHPLFIEELIKELLDSGAVSVLNGTVRARLDGATLVPRTLRTLIAGRVSRLDPADRAVLQASAILGEPILMDVLAALTKESVAQITRAAGHLIARDLMRATGPAQMGFASPMHGEIVLDAIPPEARRELHAAAAEAFIKVMNESSIDEDTGSPIRADYAERIGNHLYEAGDRDRAATHFARVASHKMRVLQLEPAIRLFVRALDLCEYDQRAPSELATWIASLSDAVGRVRASPDLRAVTTRVLRRIDAAGTLEERVLARVELARALGSVNQFDEAHQRLEEAFSLAGEDKGLLGRALTAEMETAARAGEFARGTRALERLEVLGPIETSRALTWSAYVHANSGDTERALAALDAAERIDSADDLIAASDREKQRVLVYFARADYKAAAAAAPRAIEVARAGGLRYDVSAALHNLGDAARRIGELSRAYAALTESKEIAESLGNDRLVTLDRIHLAYLDAISSAGSVDSGGGSGGAAEAEKLLRDLIAYAESRGYVSDAREGRVMLGQLLARQGTKGEARRELEKVLAMSIAQGDVTTADECRELLSGV